MKQPIRNLKGEIVDYVGGSDTQPWWHLSTSTWLLIAGLVILNVGCFFDAAALDRLFRCLDVRQWPWWYFLIVLAAAALLCRCGFIAAHYSEYDKYERDEAKKFVRLTIFALVVGILLIVLRFFNFWWEMLYAFKDWFAHGQSSKSAMLFFLIALTLAALAVYLVVSWLVAFLGRNL